MADVNVMTSAQASRGVKREHLDDDEKERPRHVLQRTDNGTDFKDETQSLKLLLKDLHRGDEDALEKTLKQVWDILYQDGNDAYQMKKAQDFFNFGGHASVVSLMENHSHCESIQEYGVSVIHVVIYQNVHIANTVQKADGVEVVMGAMKRFGNNREIQYRGLYALYDMFPGNASARTLAVDQNVISIILDSIKEFPNDVEIVLLGCKLLLSLCRIKKLLKPIFDTNALTTLANVRDSHKENKKIGMAVAIFMSYFVEYQKTV